jgi:hypothetical protein
MPRRGQEWLGGGRSRDRKRQKKTEKYRKKQKKTEKNRKKQKKNRKKTEKKQKQNILDF